MALCVCERCNYFLRVRKRCKDCLKKCRFCEKLLPANACTNNLKRKILEINMARKPPFAERTWPRKPPFMV